MARKRQDPGIRQNQFICAAQELFFTKGYEATSIQDVLIAVGGGSGLSPSVFYYYFSSKDELFECAVEEYAGRYASNIIKEIEDPAMGYSAKMQAVLEQVRTAIEDFAKIEAYFDRDDSRSRRFNQMLSENVRSAISKPLSRLLYEAAENGFLPETPLLRTAGVDLMAEILLWSIYPLFHKGKEKNGKHHNNRYLELMPMLFSQLLGLPENPSDRNVASGRVDAL